jgi:hypothetical protein
MTPTVLVIATNIGHYVPICKACGWIGAVYIAEYDASTVARRHRC